MAKKKRTISLKAIQGALKSPKTPEHLRAGLLRKYGHLFKNAPKDWHMKRERDEHEKWLKTKDPLDKFYYAGKLDAHRESRKYKENPKEATDGYISERVKSPKKFDPRSFRTKRVDSTLLTFGCPKGKWSSKKKICKVPVELQRKLKAKRSNPVDKPELIYDKVLAIEAVKGRKSHWPDEQFRHDFSSGAKIYGNPDGSLTIRGKKPLWKRKRYSDKDLKELGGKV